MKRRPSNLAVVLSLAIALGTAILWARNAGGGDAAVCFLDGGHVCGFLSSKGQFMLVVTNAALDDRRAWTLTTTRLADDEVDKLREDLLDETWSGFRRPSRLGWHWEAAGFNISARNRDSFDLPGIWHRAIAIPYWLILPLSLIIPTGALVRHCIRTRRAARGRCIICGYNLHASFGDRCPECGHHHAPILS